ncbi:MAG: hypothetical protein ACI9DK_002568 [Vicingaceae bacterium]
MEINHNKTNTVLTIGKVDISALEKRIHSLTIGDWDSEEDFQLNYNKRILKKDDKNVAALGTTRHIVFRFTDKNKTPYEYIESSRWDSWKEFLLPIMNEATTYLNYKKPHYPKVMLANLPSQAFIRPHTDGKAVSLTPHKIHIAIETNESTFFYLEKDRYLFEKGVAYEVNNSKMHAVANNGSTDRIHLIFECIDLNAQNEEIKRQIKNFKIVGN